MKHDLVHVGENETDILFACNTCGKPIGFNRPGIGEPSPVQENGEWHAPDDADKYMDPCTG